MTEALGVPDNLYETAVKIFDRFLKWTKKLKEKPRVSGVFVSEYIIS